MDKKMMRVTYLVFIGLILAITSYSATISTNGYFYLPDIGDSGTEIRSAWTAVQEATDAVIKANVTAVSSESGLEASIGDSIIVDGEIDSEAELNTLIGDDIIVDGDIDTLAELNAIIGDATLSANQDHGLLTGLTDDDHTQYGNLSQDEDVTGSWDFGSITIDSTTCLDVSSDQIYHDTDCDGTKEAGEEFIDQSESDLVYERCFTLQSPDNTEHDNIVIWHPYEAITVSQTYCKAVGGTSVIVVVSDGTNNLDSQTCTTSGVKDIDLSNNTWTADEEMQVDIGTVTGSVDWVNFCIRYTKT